MDFNLLFQAFATVMLNPTNFFFVFIGITAGIIVGALPGLTATMGCALLIPFTFGMPPIQGLLMLLGIFCGGICRRYKKRQRKRKRLPSEEAVFYET